jgi:hypothetical protein
MQEMLSGNANRRNLTYHPGNRVCLRQKSFFFFRVFVLSCVAPGGLRTLRGGFFILFLCPLPPAPCPSPHYPTGNR